MKNKRKSKRGLLEDFFETDGKINPEVDDTLDTQSQYHQSRKGKRALKRARDRYDKSDPERRRKQKRDYMRRVREKNPDAWRH